MAAVQLWHDSTRTSHSMRTAHSTLHADCGLQLWHDSMRTAAVQCCKCGGSSPVVRPRTRVPAWAAPRSWDARPPAEVAPKAPMAYKYHVSGSRPCGRGGCAAAHHRNASGHDAKVSLRG